MVNQEIENLEQGLEIGLSLLRPGGRLAVIAYHSLEDRAVKRLVREHIGRWEALPAGGQRRLGRAPEVRWVTPKPVTPTRAEISANPRARSAKLRVAERIK
jgi:16S rRNA (cytosine1402-N4)-methyltransferase